MVAPSPPSERSTSRMTKDDVLFGYRLQLFDLAGRTTVANACRVFGVHRSTYYRWKREVDRQGLEMLRPRARRRRAMPNQIAPHLEERIVAFALGHPGLGPKRAGGPSRTAGLRRPRRLRQRDLEGPRPPWAEHAPEASFPGRRLP